MKQYYKLALITASMTLSLGLLTAKSDSAQAATVTYDFTLNSTNAEVTNPFATGYFSFEPPTNPDFNGTVLTVDFKISNPGEFTFYPPSVLIISGVFQGLFAYGYDRFEEERTISFPGPNGIVCTNRSYSYADIYYDINLSNFSQNYTASGGYESTPRDLCGGSFHRNFYGSIARGDVIYLQRSIPESSTMWGLTVLGLAFLLQRKSKFYPNFRYKSVKTDVSNHSLFSSYG